MNQKLGQEKCSEHSDSIFVLGNSEIDIEKRGLCTKCMANIYKREVIHITSSIVQINLSKQLIKEARQKLLQSNLEHLNELSDSFKQLKNFYIQQIDLIINSIKKWTESIFNIEDDFINNLEQKENNDHQLFVKFIKEEQEIRILNYTDFKVKIQNLLLSLTEIELIQKCKVLLEKQSLEPLVVGSTKKKDNEETEEVLEQLKPFTYNLIPNNSIQQKELCLAIAFNKDNSIVIVGFENQIKVFEFKDEQLKQLQILKEHQNYIYTLNFMKKSNQFISGSCDNFIIIWSTKDNNEWICKQKLNGHTNQILCLILNISEDIIISGSSDFTIKIWMRQSEWKSSQTITDHKSLVRDLSINDSQNKVISCGDDKLILIIEQSSQDLKWNIIQKINVGQNGYRICFINDDLFTFQPLFKEQMHFYEISKTNRQYSKTKDIIVKCGSETFLCLFPQQYIKQKCLVVNKNGQFINLIRKKENGDFSLEQSIDFETNGIFGIMSDDGEYLITWDKRLNEIQIRKYQEK